jgi:fructose-bisphosphate aldolase class I
MNNFIAAMDHSGGSTGGVLERYGQEYTEDDKMAKVHQMRLRMVNSKYFNHNNIWAAILYKDTVDRGMVSELSSKGISSILKIDSGCKDDGTLKVFDISGMIEYANSHGCTGTKMRSIIKSADVLDDVLDQQFKLAETISKGGLLPIIEPEVPIDHDDKENIESLLRRGLGARLNWYQGKCILKLTLPDVPNIYHDLLLYSNINKIVGLSGGYSTDEACRRLTQNKDMTASFSRGLSEGLFVHQTDNEFEDAIGNNIKMIIKACQT